MRSHLYVAALSCNRQPMAYAMVLYNAQGTCANFYTAVCEETLAIAQQAFRQGFYEERLFGLGRTPNPAALAARMYADTLAVRHQGNCKVINITDVPDSLLNLAHPGFPQPRYIIQAMKALGYYPSMDPVETCRKLGHTLNPQHSLLRQAQRWAIIHQAAFARDARLNDLRIPATA